MKAWVREPLLHFLVAGALLFAAYAWLQGEEIEEPRTVRVSAAEVNWLREAWTRQWQRPPSEDELRGLVTGHLKEVLLAREALALDLGDNDTVIRRRLAQKMEFLVQDTARLVAPGDDELRRYFGINAARYRAPARTSFTQIFFRTEAAAHKGRAELATKRTDELGDSSLLEREHSEADEQAVASQFGDAFSRAVVGLEAGRWHGPIASAYGFHLVRVSARQEARPLPFEEARPQLIEDWQREQQAKAAERFLAGLLKKYDVVADKSVEPLIAPLLETVR
jgi:parvulin-like peptidyl-prolyl isomerase